MIHYVLCSRVASKSGRALAEAIGERQGMRCRYFCFLRNHRQGRYVRYGNLGVGKDDCLNNVASVRLAADKFQAALVMQHYGVRTPRVLIDNDVTTKYERVFRNSSRHSGNDKPTYLSPGLIPGEVLRRYDYAVEYIIKNAEYRVHVVCGEVIRVQRKKRIRDFEGRDRRIWSEPNGWCLVETDFTDEALFYQARQALFFLGLDFGAVDIVQSRKDGAFYVLEVNTAPGITCGGVEKYADAFVKWDRNTPEES